MTSLESLGWNSSWANHFAALAEPDQVSARVSAEHRELYHCETGDSETHAQVSGRLRHEARGRADFPAVGDWVVLSRPLGEGVAVISAILPRRNRFSRRAPGRDSDEQIIAANLDTLFVVTSLNRDFNPRRLERYLAAAAAPHLETVVLLSKSDLHDDPASAVLELRALAPDIAVHAISAHTGDGLDALTPYLGTGRTVALVGSSGVGKSTLLNRLLGAERLTTREVREDDDRGRHTTTHREMVRLPQGGLLIDNPGMRELRLWDEGSDVDQAFTDVTALAADCFYPDCTHQHEPRCAVTTAVAEGRLDAERLESYRKLQRELAFEQRRHDPEAARERKRFEKQMGKQLNKWLKKKRG